MSDLEQPDRDPVVNGGPGRSIPADCEVKLYVPVGQVAWFQHFNPHLRVMATSPEGPHLRAV